MEGRCSKDLEMENLKKEMEVRESQCRAIVDASQRAKLDMQQREVKLQEMLDEVDKKLKEIEEVKSQCQLTLQMADSKRQRYDNELAILNEQQEQFKTKLIKFQQREKHFEERILGIDGEQASVKATLEAARNLEVSLRAKEVELKKRREELDNREVDIIKESQCLAEEKKKNEIDAESNRARAKELASGNFRAKVIPGESK